MKQPFIFGSALFVLVSLSTAPAANKNSWNDYKPRTLQSIADMNQSPIAQADKANAADKFLLSGDNFPSRVTLLYTGKSRRLAGKRRELLEFWKKSNKGSLPGNVDKLLSTEMLFRERGKDYWIAVQKPLIKAMSNEVKAGGTMRAYIILIGAIKAGDRWEWLFALNEFDARGR